MFGRYASTSGWDDYRNDILAFSRSLSRLWTPSKKAKVFLLAAQRGYARVGLTDVPDTWRAMAAVCLWNACCHPDKLQLVMAGTTKSGHAWVRFLKSIATDAPDRIRQQLLFAEDDSMIVAADRRDSDAPVLSVLSPDHLLRAVKLPGVRPVVLVLPDMDRVPAKWMPALQSYVQGPKDQWLAALPARTRV